MLQFLVSPLFFVAGSPLSIGDLLGFLTGLGCVALAARSHIANFPVGIANSLILALVFFQTRLFGDMCLQGVFIVLSVQGWMAWRKGPDLESTPPLPGQLKDHWLGALATVATALVLRQLLLLAGGAAPWPDAFITASSLWAQWLLNRRSLSCWAWWIVVDLVSIPLYWSRALPLIALLYTVFLGLCLQGWIAWSRRLPSAQAQEVEA